MKAVVLQDVTLFDGGGASPLRGASVVVQGERIVEVGRGPVARPDGAEVLDLGGGFLLPGLFDAHAHVDGGEDAAAELLLAGVTAIRNPARRDEAAPTCQGLTVLSAGRPIDTPDSAFPYAARVETPAEIRAEVRRQAAAGVDMVKLYVGLTPELVRGAVEEAHAAGLPAVGDLVRTSWTEAARAGIDFLCHAAPRHAELLAEGVRGRYLDDLARGAHPVCRWLELLDPDGPEVAGMVAALAGAGVAVDPTLVSLEALLFAGDPDYHAAVDPAGGTPAPELAPATVVALRRRASRCWDRALGLVRALHRGGVTLLAGSDCPRPWVRPGVSLHREVRLLQQAGLAAADALAAATGRCAAALGVGDETGTIRPGRRADLLLLAADPLADLTNTAAIRWRMVRGAMGGPS
jgi:imidazolonepropionase-like amidohydrolase